MITGLSHAMRKLATWWVLAVTGGAFAVFAVAFFATSLPFSIAHMTSLCGDAPPDVRLYTSGRDGYKPARRRINGQADGELGVLAAAASRDRLPRRT
jgi:hypothetical protein